MFFMSELVNLNSTALNILIMFAFDTPLTY